MDCENLHLTEVRFRPLKERHYYFRLLFLEKFGFRRLIPPTIEKFIQIIIIWEIYKFAGHLTLSNLAIETRMIMDGMFDTNRKILKLYLLFKWQRAVSTYKNFKMVM